MSNIMRERSVSVVKCLTKDCGAAESSLTSATALCLWERNINPFLDFVEPRKIQIDITENCRLWRGESNQTNTKEQYHGVGLCFNSVKSI